MKTMMKNTAIMMAITLIAGFVLGLVYENTKDAIAESKLKAKNEACKEVFNDAEEFEIMENAFTDEHVDMFAENGFGAITLDEVAVAKSSTGEALGYVLTITTNEGYAGAIQFTLGITNDKTVNGISILATGETPGLGLEAEKVLKPQYANKKVDQFIVTKTGATAESEIDAISGATITSNAITNGINAGLFYFDTVLEGGGSNE